MHSLDQERSTQSEDRTRFATRSMVFPALLLGMVMACEGSCCEDPPLTGIDGGAPGPICALDTDCGASNLGYRFGECGPSACEADSDCCPGTRCRLDFFACVPLQLDPEYSCENDGDCPDPAMRCQEVTLGDRDPLLACAYDRCTGDDECGIGRSCYHSVCVQRSPCGGACPEGTACDVLTSQCAPVAAEASGCAEDCGAAGLMVFSDPDNMSGETCCQLECQCKGLPPLLPNRFGRYARVAVGQGEVLVSAYDAEYGDLVLAHFSLEGGFESVEFVDGMPDTGDIVADPNGPRGGIADPGPHVGTHTSIATDASGFARIAYHDVDNRSLKVALQGESGWTSYTVDSPGAEGELGTFTDIDIDAATGQIQISYFAHDVIGAPGINGPASGIKIARSRNATPASAADWEIRFVDARPTYDPCDATCAAGQVCVLGADGAECRDEASSCSPACSSSSLCVQDGAQVACLATAIPPSALEFPKARGLYTSIVADGSGSFVAYYDSIDGDVRVASVSSAGATTAVVLDGDGVDGRRDGDVGRFPAVAKAGTDVVVVYEDFSRHEVRAWRGALGSPGTYSLVDSGQVGGAPGKRFVGGGARVALDANAEPLTVYQDASNLDLKFARYNGGNWQPERLLSDGAHGFYSDVAVQAQNVYIVSVLAELDARGRERSRVGLTLRNLP